MLVQGRSRTAMPKARMMEIQGKHPLVVVSPTAAEKPKRCPLRLTVTRMCRDSNDCAGFVPGWAWEAMQQASQVVDL